MQHKMTLPNIVTITSENIQNPYLRMMSSTTTTPTTTSTIAAAAAAGVVLGKSFNITTAMPNVSSGAGGAATAATTPWSFLSSTSSLAKSASAATAADAFLAPRIFSCTYEQVMPGIYFSTDFIDWNEEKLRINDFKYIIIIDKHTQELYYTAPLFKLSSTKPNTTSTSSTSSSSSSSTPSSPTSTSSSSTSTSSSSSSSSSLSSTSTSSLSPLSSNSNISFVNDYIDDDLIGCAFADIDYVSNINPPNYSTQFDILNLNFGEKSYITKVLPNCYRAVRFISKAKHSGGSVLIIDCNGDTQKCITIVVAYLMYTHNIIFCDAFANLKTYYKKADLDNFYINQLLEYEPILQVQLASSCGHSCARDMRAALYKRKRSCISNSNNANDNDNTGSGSSCIYIDGNNKFFGQQQRQQLFRREEFNILNPLSLYNIEDDEMRETTATTTTYINTAFYEEDRIVTTPQLSQLSNICHRQKQQRGTICEHLSNHNRMMVLTTRVATATTATPAITATTTTAAVPVPTTSTVAAAAAATATLSAIDVDDIAME